MTASRSMAWFRWWFLWRYPNGLMRWKHCPFCEGHGSRTWGGFFRHLTWAHLRPVFARPQLPRYGPVDVRCPTCGTRKIEMIACDWPPGTGFCCEAGHAWVQFLNVRPLGG